MKRRIITYGLLMVLALAFVGCASTPKSFVRTMEPGWASIEIRTDIPYDKAWSSVVDLLVKIFDLEILAKEDGYIRTAWLYSWTGQMQQNYRVRVTVKFSEDKKKVEVKSEANYLSTGPFGGGGWIVGTDERLLTTLKTDIMGSIGRTTR